MTETLNLCSSVGGGGNKKKKKKKGSIDCDAKFKCLKLQAIWARNINAQNALSPPPQK